MSDPPGWFSFGLCIKGQLEPAHVIESFSTCWLIAMYIFLPPKASAPRNPCDCCICVCWANSEDQSFPSSIPFCLHLNIFSGGRMNLSLLLSNGYNLNSDSCPEVFSLHNWKFSELWMHGCFSVDISRLCVVKIGGWRRLSNEWVWLSWWQWANKIRMSLLRWEQHHTAIFL